MEQTSGATSTENGSLAEFPNADAITAVHMDALDSNHLVSSAIKSESPSDDGQSKKRFGPKQDLLLLRQVKAECPFSSPWGTMMTAWNKIADDLNALEDFGLETTGKACQNRFHALMFKHRQRYQPREGYNPPAPPSENEAEELSQYNLLEDLEKMMRDEERNKPARPLESEKEADGSGKRTKRSGPDTPVKRRKRSDPNEAPKSITGMMQRLVEMQNESLSVFREMLRASQQQEIDFRRQECEERRRERQEDREERERARREEREERERDRKAENERFQSLLQAVLKQ